MQTKKQVKEHMPAQGSMDEGKQLQVACYRLQGPATGNMQPAIVFFNIPGFGLK